MPRYCAATNRICPEITSPFSSTKIGLLKPSSRIDWATAGIAASSMSGFLPFWIAVSGQLNGLEIAFLWRSVGGSDEIRLGQAV